MASTPDPDRLRRLALGGFSAVTVALLLIAALAVGTLQLEDAVRSYVKAESLWSKAQKESVISLQEYARTGNESDWQGYREAVQSNRLSRTTRQALQSSPPDLPTARESLRRFGMAEGEIGGMIRLFRGFEDWGPMRRSIRLWARGDSLIAELQTEARRVRRQWRSPPPDTAVLAEALQRVGDLNTSLERVERAFTASIDDAADRAGRWSLWAIGGLTALLVLAGGWLTWRLYRTVRRREEAVRRSEERYRSLFENSRDTIALTREDGTIVDVSPAAEELTGYPGEALVGMNVRTLYPDPDDRKRYREAIEEKGYVENYEVELERADGSVRTCLLTSTVRTDEAGEVIGYQSIVRDVTEEQERTRQLRRSEERYRTLFELSNDAIFVFDLEGTIREANERAAEFLGVPVGELKGTSVLDLHPPEALPDAEAAVERTRSQGGGRFELVFLTDEDERRVGAVSTRRVEVGDESLFQAVVRDVTEQGERQQRLKESERRYRELFERNVAGVFRTQPGGTIVECNDAFAEIFGYDSPDELEGQDAHALFPSAEHRDRYLDRLREEGRLVNEEFRLQRQDGTSVWVLENSFLTEDPETGELINEGTLIDITDRKRAEDRLEEMAFRDPLTELGNRRMLKTQAASVLSLADRQDRRVGIAYLDLDGFKGVNDRWGHEAGDAVLRELGERLKRGKRQTDVVARVGGDEFVVVLADLEAADDALSAARRMVEAISGRFSVKGHDVELDLSTGIAVYPDDARELEELLRLADQAMYRAKGGKVVRC